MVLNTSDRIRTILNLVKEEHVRWICLREEPVIYMNSRPFVLRELQHPFRNMVYWLYNANAHCLRLTRPHLPESIGVESSRSSLV